MIQPSFISGLETFLASLPENFIHGNETHLKNLPYTEEVKEQYRIWHEEIQHKFIRVVVLFEPKKDSFNKKVSYLVMAKNHDSPDYPFVCHITEDFVNFQNRQCFPTEAMANLYMDSLI